MIIEDHDNYYNGELEGLSLGVDQYRASLVLTATYPGPA